MRLDRDRHAQHVIAPPPPLASMRDATSMSDYAAQHVRTSLRCSVMSDSCSLSGGSTCHVTGWRSVRGLASGTVWWRGT